MKFYHYSDNYYIECEDKDIYDNDFEKIFEEYNKVARYKFKKPEKIFTISLF